MMNQCASIKNRSNNNTLGINLLMLCVFVENVYPLISTVEVNDFIIYARYLLVFTSFIYVVVLSWPLLFKPPVVIYFIWCIYVFINNTQQGYEFAGSLLQMLLSFFPSFVVFVACVYVYNKSENKLLNVIICSLYFYTLYALSISSGFGFERLGGDKLNANSIGIRAALVFFFLIVQYIRKRVSMITVIALSVIPIYVIIMTASRTAFMIFGLLILYFVMRSSSNKIVLFSKILFIVLCYYGFNLIAESTFIGERLLNTTTQVENSALETGTFWDYLGDRGYQYYVSAPIIKNYPICGIGMGNFWIKVQEATSVYHSEYLIQLCECGIVGFILYFSLYYWIIKYLIILKRKKCIDANISLICILCLIAIMSAGVVTRVSYYSIYSCCLAFMVYEIIKDKKLYYIK